MKENENENGKEVTLADVLAELLELRQTNEDAQRLDGPLTREQASSYLQIHPATLYRWSVEEQRITYCRLGNGDRAALRWTRADLDDFLRREAVGHVKG